MCTHVLETRLFRENFQDSMVECSYTKHCTVHILVGARRTSRESPSIPGGYGISEPYFELDADDSHDVVRCDQAKRIPGKGIDL